MSRQAQKWIILDTMKKKAKSKTNKDTCDFHFIMNGELDAILFKEEADKIGRPYTEHFRRILKSHFHPEENIND